jgi:hypothetical protein
VRGDRFNTDHPWIERSSPGIDAAGETPSRLNPCPRRSRAAWRLRTPAWQQTPTGVPRSSPKSRAGASPELRAPRNHGQLCGSGLGARRVRGLTGSLGCR